jgi:hypothetical protein
MGFKTVARSASIAISGGSFGMNGLSMNSLPVRSRSWLPSIRDCFSMHASTSGLT